MEENLLKARNGCHSVERLRLVITPRIPAGYPNMLKNETMFPRTADRCLSHSAHWIAFCDGGQVGRGMNFEQKKTAVFGGGVIQAVFPGSHRSCHPLLIGFVFSGDSFSCSVTMSFLSN
jgi:hypothetical protein